MQRQRLIIAGLAITAIALATGSVYLTLQSRNSDNNNVNSFDTVQASIINQIESSQNSVLGLSTSKGDLSNVECKDLFSSEIFQSFKTDRSYSALSQIGWSTLSIRDMGQSDNIIKNCLYTFLGNTQIDLTFISNDSNSSNSTNNIISSNISQLTNSGITNSTPAFNYDFGEQSGSNKCTSIIIDQQGQFKYGQIKYLNSLNCNDKKNISLNEAFVKVLAVRLNLVK